MGAQPRSVEGRFSRSGLSSASREAACRGRSLGPSKAIGMGPCPPPSDLGAKPCRSVLAALGGSGTGEEREKGGGEARALWTKAGAVRGVGGGDVARAAPLSTCIASWVRTLTVAATSHGCPSPKGLGWRLKRAPGLGLVRRRGPEPLTTARLWSKAVDHRALTRARAGP